MAKALNRIDPKKLHLNKTNPRLIKDKGWLNLLDSIREFPQMFEHRPIVVDESMVVIGGNQRLRACLELGLKAVPYSIAKGWSDEQKAEFIVKDNLSYGQWDHDILANQFDSGLLDHWGVDVWIPKDVDLDSFFEENKEEKKEAKNKITLEYTDDDYEVIQEAFKKHSGSKEAIIFNLLTK